MIDEFAKAYLHDELRDVRAALVDRVQGTSDYDSRRPLTATGTNLLGLVNHLTMSEIVYFGAVFRRPVPWPHARFDDPGFRNRDSLWVSGPQSREEIVNGYRRAWVHADATIGALPIDAAGFVPWWPRPDVLLFNVLVHVLTEANRHAGHADILREQLDAASGSWGAGDDWAAHRGRIEEAARRAGRA